MVDFSEIEGQRQVIGALQNSIKYNKVGHAYVFSGPKGIGKRTVARAFSVLLLCEKQNAENPCGDCMPCRMLDSESNPDFKKIEVAGSSISVDEIRNIQSDIIIRPLYSSRKVYLIADADKMTVQAQNCLLKTLEEPPGYAVIILTTSNYYALMETIRSRTLRYDFKKNTSGEVRRVLEARLGKSIEGMDFISSYSDGVIGSALELANSGHFNVLREKSIDILLKMADSKLLDIFEVCKFFEENKEDVDSILDVMLLFYRDLLIVKKGGRENILINSDKKDIILKNVSNFSTRKVMGNIEAVEAVRRNIKQNANYQLAIEVMLMKLQEECGQW